MPQHVRTVWRWSAYIGLGLLLIVLIALWSSQYWLKGWIEDTAASRTGRTLQIGDLDIDWSLHPLVTAKRVRFANASWAEQGQMATADRVALRVSLPALLHGALVFPELRLHGARILLQRGPEQQVNWNFDTKTGQRGKSNRVPQIERLEIADTTVRYLEQDRNTDFTVALHAEPDAEAEGALNGTGEGTYRGESFQGSFQGEPPMHLFTADKPYEMKLHVKAGDTEATLQGQIRDPRALKASDLNLRLRLEGPDPARLHKLVGLPMPSLPPYRIEGRLIRDGESWKLSDFDGRVGDSDLHGDIAVAVQGERPRLTADLRSKSLDFDDLGSLVGGNPDPSETASPEQRRAQQQQRSARALPDKPMDLTQVRAMDASVQFQGKHVHAGKLPIDEVDVRMQLQQGRMQFDPLRFRAGGGKVDAQITLDASKETATATLNGEVSNLDLRRLLADLDIANDSVGKVGGRAKLWMHGNSLASLLGSADGGAYLIMTGGRLDRILVELAGLDIGEAVLAKLGEGQRSIPIRCGYADMRAENGLLQLSDVVIDSSDTLFTASGHINLRTEQLDVELDPKPKDVSLFAARSNLHIGGTLGDPKVRPGAATLAKGAATAALAAVAGPATALVPLVETGGGKDSANCASFTEAVDAGAIGAKAKPGPPQ